MALGKKVWINARSLFEAGASLSIISEETGISKSQISKKSKTEEWKKGDKEYVVKKTILLPTSGLLYIIQAGETDYYKIGVTLGSISQRLSGLQTGNHLQLKVKFTKYEENVRLKEKELHQKYREYNSSGEWFKLSNSLIEDLIKEFINGN